MSGAAAAVEEEYFSDQDVPRGMNDGLVADKGDFCGGRRNETLQTAEERLAPVRVPVEPIIRIWSRQPHPPTQLPLLLFDLNGVLVRHTRRRVGCHEFWARPGVEHLVRLLPHFELGVYTSATERTVRQCLAQLHRQVWQELAKRRTEADGVAWPESVPARLFSPILVRSHCAAPTPEAIAARGGNPWDTLKPLARYFSDLDRVILLDDSAHKILPAETRNHLLVPAWASGERGEREGGKREDGGGDSEGADLAAADPDAVIPTLVDGLIRAAASPSLLDALPDIQARLEAALTGAQAANEVGPATGKVLPRALAGAGAESSISETSLLAAPADPALALLEVFEDKIPKPAPLIFQNASASPAPASAPRTLGGELLLAAALASPSAAELGAVASVARRVEAALRRRWPRMRAKLFGSWPQAVALPGADVDLVMEGDEPGDDPWAGDAEAMSHAVGRWARKAELRRLHLVRAVLRRAGLLEGGEAALVAARVPVLKFRMRARLLEPGWGAGQGRVSNGAAPPVMWRTFSVDLSAGPTRSVEAAAWVNRHVQSLPMLRPLVVGLKALLRDRDLATVFEGGVPSYAVVVLALAFLLHEGHRVEEKGGGKERALAPDAKRVAPIGGLAERPSPAKRRRSGTPSETAAIFVSCSSDEEKEEGADVAIHITDTDSESISTSLSSDSATSSSSDSSSSDSAASSSSDSSSSDSAASSSSDSSSSDSAASSSSDSEESVAIHCLPSILSLPTVLPPDAPAASLGALFVELLSAVAAPADAASRPLAWGIVAGGRAPLLSSPGSEEVAESRAAPKHAQLAVLNPHDSAADLCAKSFRLAEAQACAGEAARALRQAAKGAVIKEEEEATLRILCGGAAEAEWDAALNAQTSVLPPALASWLEQATPGELQALFPRLSRLASMHALLGRGSAAEAARERLRVGQAPEGAEKRSRGQMGDGTEAKRARHHEQRSGPSSRHGSHQHGREPHYHHGREPHAPQHGRELHHRHQGHVPHQQRGHVPHHQQQGHVPQHGRQPHHQQHGHVPQHGRQPHRQHSHEPHHQHGRQPYREPTREPYHQPLLQSHRSSSSQRHLQREPPPRQPSQGRFMGSHGFDPRFQAHHQSAQRPDPGSDWQRHASHGRPHAPRHPAHDPSPGQGARRWQESSRNGPSRYEKQRHARSDEGGREFAKQGGAWSGGSDHRTPHSRQEQSAGRQGQQHYRGGGGFRGGSSRGRAHDQRREELFSWAASVDAADYRRR